MRLQKRLLTYDCFQLNNAEYADVHANLTQGWAAPIPENQLHYQQMPLSNKPFELKYKNGAVSSPVYNTFTYFEAMNITGTQVC